jgi:pilus assembly protein CpaF
MSATFSPSFGRRVGGRSAVAELAPRPVAVPPPEPNTNASTPGGVPSASIAELRAICLARLEPTAVASMPAERLTTDVERLISEIATERRIQLNGREQRALAGELVNDIPDRTFVERSGKVTLANIRFRDQSHLSNICQRIAAAVGRRVDESSPMVDARLKDGSRVNIVFQPLALDGPYLSIRKFGKKGIDCWRSPRRHGST